MNYHKFHIFDNPEASFSLVENFNLQQAFGCLSTASAKYINTYSKKCGKIQNENGYLIYVTSRVPGL